jgi:uncharacterized protein (TIGR03083 family)
MEWSRFIDCLTADAERFRDVAAKDLDAPVPSCPGWSVADLVRHVAVVYLHKIECMRQGKAPEPWPPDDAATAEPMALLGDAWPRLREQFVARAPESTTYTWYEPDQTTRFWVRRMAQETVIHRIDAELALRTAVQPVPDDLAVDGIDEVLTVFLGYQSQTWCDDFGPDLAQADNRPVLISAGGEGWLVRAAPGGVSIEAGVGSGPVAADAAVRGEPGAMLRWLWGRGRGNSGFVAEGGDLDVTVEGDAELVGRLRRLLVTATQ